MENRFEPVRLLEWRNARLDFGTVPALVKSLETQAPTAGLRRARDADDLIALGDGQVAACWRMADGRRRYGLHAAMVWIYGGRGTPFMVWSHTISLKSPIELHVFTWQGGTQSPRDSCKNGRRHLVEEYNEPLIQTGAEISHLDPTESMSSVLFGV